MGLTFIEGTLRSAAGRERRVRFLVDSGAVHSLLPQADWKALELEPKRTEQFTLADGTIVERRVGECHFALAGRDRYSPVILGEPGDDQALLGAVTLETLGLMLDPFKRNLHAMKLRLA